MGTTVTDSEKVRIKEELLQGQESANQLHELLLHQHKPIEVDGEEHKLVVKILTSFTHTLSMLTTTNHHQNRATSNCTSDDQRSEDSGVSKKRPVASRDKRGCYKRKKNSQTWTTVSSTMEDSHAWRKYGQKQILNSNHPRSYFRCTHKYDQGCRATKQVQRMENDPQMYHITYIGNHTCRITSNVIISTSTTTHSPPDHLWNFSSSPKVIKHEYFSCKNKEEEEEEETRTTQSDLSSLDSIMWEDLMPFESSKPAETDPASVYYSCTSNSAIKSHSFVDMVFDHEFHFDETDFM